MLKKIAVGLSLLSMSAMANAGPLDTDGALPITETEMQEVSARGFVDDIAAGAIANLSVNVNTQISVPTATAISVCAICGADSEIMSTADSVGINNNFQQNFVSQ